jgi:hypothetical protein
MVWIEDSAVVNSKIAAFIKAVPVHLIQEGARILILGPQLPGQDAYAVFLAGLLRTRNDRPNGRSAPEKRNELPSRHSITSCQRHGV